QLASLAGHRLPSGPGKETPCAFLDDNADHPLGRKIRALDDDMHSSYRIRDRQIIEVNRRMKDARFTITVLNNDLTPEKKFLPTAYVVNTWNNDSNQLVSSVSFFHTWKRVGQWDLPAQLMVVTARGAASGGGDSVAATGVDVWSVAFAHVEPL